MSRPAVSEFLGKCMYMVIGITGGACVGHGQQAHKANMHAVARYIVSQTQIFVAVRACMHGCVDAMHTCMDRETRAPVLAQGTSHIVGSLHTCMLASAHFQKGGNYMVAL